MQTALRLAVLFLVLLSLVSLPHLARADGFDESGNPAVYDSGGSMGGEYCYGTKWYSDAVLIGFVICMAVVVSFIMVP